MTTGKTISLTRWTFVGKVMSLLFNMLSRLVITFLPRSKRLLISWLQSPSAVILEPQKIKSDIVSCRGPAPVDPGNLKVGTASASLEKYIFNYRYIERLETSGEKRLNNLDYME